MVNLYSFIKHGDAFRKLQVNELLFVEYTCMQEETKFGIWSDSNYFAFVSSGKKMWKSIYHDYEAEQGDILFIKKGANLTHQFFDDEFCAIFFFIPDDFIKSFLKKNPHFLNTTQKDLSSQDAVLRVQADDLLNNYYRSISSYLALTEQPNEQLLTLKFEELLLSIFTNVNHQQLNDYFISLCQDQDYHMSRVMEENFGYNLKIEDYAQLCHMSLTKFKKAFKAYYKTTPAVWLKQRKLDLAMHRLLNSALPINQLSFECGFEDPSHFIRVFKQKHKVTPLQYRKQHLNTNKIG
ncbi:helix-turn-helix domain-containing protein [Muriicola sp. Z0-33]|uniref:helix-turn-helix domain-containing protein n=1 Tax=Muriicola sp. Z0-33 TaxID=2816957 RepID=UPI0022391262|nr:AraC family transcriptional regulator [Muriicola sp. Z0-33]MCW5515707.1 helix-turn-helix transcriptional regulator [Muriicola sp. Z0-33]